MLKYYECSISNVAFFFFFPYSLLFKTDLKCKYKYLACDFI